MTRRNLELILLCVGAPIVILLFAMLALNQGQQLGWTTLGVPIGIFVAFIAAHIAVRFFAADADPAILPLVFVLAGIGIAFVTRLAPDLAYNQVIWLFVGVLCMVLVLAFSRRLEKLANYKYTLMILGFILLLSPLVPGLGQEIYGSRIWLSIGPLSFQPGELAKVVIVLFLASYLASNRELLSVFTWRIGPFRLPDFQTIAPMLVMWAIALLIVIFEKDLGSALVFFFVFLAMLYVATGKKFYLVIGFMLMILGCVGAYMGFTHVQVRVANWLDPFADPQGAGYQMLQGLYSMADGDLFGVGIGRGLAYQIPVVESDFIFAAIAEECGLMGSAGVLLVYLSFAIRGYLTAARAKSDFSSMVAVGLTTTIVLQAFIIVGGVTRLIPLTGLTLPFVSQGGSSLLASFIAVGFLMRCGDEGTGVHEEMTNATSSLHANSVLGRVSLGRRLTTTLIILSALFALLVANLTIIMVVQAKDYQSMPGNNHTIDYGEPGFTETVATLEQAGIEWFANTEFSAKSYIFEHQGVRIGLVSCYVSHWVINNGEHIPEINATIEDVKAQGVDVLIAYMHGGVEYEKVHDTHQVRFAKYFISKGVDIVIGSHPHILQGCEMIDGVPVFYSLGNFVFGGNFQFFNKRHSTNLRYTAILQCALSFDENHNYLGCRFNIIPCRLGADSMVNQYQPYPVTGDEADAALAQIQLDTNKFWRIDNVQPDIGAMQAFIPGASPPEVRTAIVFISLILLNLYNPAINGQKHKNIHFSFEL